MSRIIVEIIAIFIACLVTFTKLDFDPDLSLLLTLFLMPVGIFVIEYIRATPERKKNKAERKRNLMIEFIQMCNKKGYTDMTDDTQSLKAKVIATDLGLDFGGDIIKLYNEAKEC